MFDPGTRWQYGPNLDWVGRIVEAISGERLDVYFRKHILDPLSMADTVFLALLHELVPKAMRLCRPQRATFYFRHRQLLPLLVKTLCKWNRSQKSSVAFCGGGGGVVGSDDGSISGKGIVAVSGKALIGSTGTGAGVASTGNWSEVL
jgi:CubicO group peptidase (beta-lactamase class C family)